MKKTEPTLRDVKEFWEKNSCGEALYLEGSDAVHYRRQSQERYRLEPYIDDLAGFSDSRGQRVLEIGVGLGADHQRFSEAGAVLHGMDLTERAVHHVRDWFRLVGLASNILLGDGQRLLYHRGSFDCAYSWGVIHHAPHPEAILAEVYRVLKPRGNLRIMIYHKWSMVGVMLWLRYGLFRFRPFISLAELYSCYLESPGTKAYSTGEAAGLLSRFKNVEIRTKLNYGDLLTSEAGQRSQGLALRIARVVWPRWAIRALFPNWGLFMLIRARKPSA